MTCIVGLVEGNTVYLGGDSATTLGNRQMIRSFPKAIKRGEFVMGCAGRALLSNVIGFITALPKQYEDQTPMEYMINNFLPPFRVAVKGLGQMHVRHEQESIQSDLLVGYRGHLFFIGTDLTVFESIDNYLSVGSGSGYALGALYAMEGTDVPPEDKVRLALEAAGRHDSFVAPPYDIESVTYDGEIIHDLINNDKPSILDNIIDKANAELKKDDDK